MHRIEKKPSLPEIIYKKILDLIKQNEFKIGEKLPGEKEFAKQLNVSRAALREALQKLEMDGYVDRRHGVGTFVISNVPKLTAGLELLESMTDLIKAKNLDPGTKDISIKREQANPNIAEHLQLKKDEFVLCFERGRTADKQPFAFDIAIAPVTLLEDDFIDNMKESIFAYLEREKNIYLTHSYCNIFSENATPELAEKLNVETGDALQVLEQIYYEKGNNPIYYGKSYIRNDVLQFHLIRRDRKSVV